MRQTGERDRRVPGFAFMAKSLACVVILFLLLAGCNADRGSPSEQAVTTYPGDQRKNDAFASSHAPTDPSPSPDYAESEEATARAVLQTWIDAIRNRQFDQAWDMMSAADHAPWPKDQWQARFADLNSIKVEALPGTLEGAAGSLYYTSQITITAQNTAGAPVRYEGEVVLRRVNDVPGASADQLHWHIDNVTLDQTH